MQPKLLRTQEKPISVFVTRRTECVMRGCLCACVLFCGWIRYNMLVANGCESGQAKVALDYTTAQPYNALHIFGLVYFTHGKVEYYYTYTYLSNTSSVIILANLVLGQHLIHV